MKKIFFLLVGMQICGFLSAQQFQGVLHYESSNGSHVATYVAQSATKGRIDCRVWGMKGNTIDSSSGHNQAVLIYDFSAGTLTKLLQIQNIASVGTPTDVWMQKRMHFDP